VALAVALLLAVIALCFQGGKLAAWWARQRAVRRLNIGALSEARHALMQAARYDPHDPTTDLMRAACFRLLGQPDRWREALEAAKRKGASPELVQREVKLGLIGSGELYPGAESLLVEAADTAVTSYDVPATFVAGYLDSGNDRLAKMLLDAWTADSPDQLYAVYMWGKYWQSQGDWRQAQARFEAVLAEQPRHEPARSTLAQVFESQARLDDAFQQYVELMRQSPASEIAVVGTARILRKQGRLEQARQMLAPASTSSSPSAAVAEQLGRIAMETGDYAAARQWFGHTGLEQTASDELQSAMATALALAGETVVSERLFDRVNAAGNRRALLYDLQVRLAIDRNDTEAANQRRRLSRPLRGLEPPAGGDDVGGASEDRPETPAVGAGELYALHCSACHGADGDGNGRAARYVFPRPLDLRAGKFRLASTRNGIPTLEDRVAVLRRGIPGTSMRSFDELSDRQRELLAGEVLKLSRRGARERFVEMFSLEGEEIDEGEIEELVEAVVEPGELVPVPPLGDDGAEAIARGREVYVKQACQSCHGDDGVGVWNLFLLDDQRRPTRPRDLAGEVFKGGQELESIYLRVVVGMPGTPHPASAGLSQRELIDLVHYCRSLSKEPKRELTNHQRALQATSRAYLAALGRTPSPRGRREE
jgi:Tfp pilus assembly protein PilF/mono/diheme cytochrome c family protein